MTKTKTTANSGTLSSTGSNTGGIFDASTYIQSKTTATAQPFGGTGIQGGGGFSNIDWDSDTYSKIRGKRVNKSKISHIDDDDKIVMGDDNIHIQPVNNGFLLTITTKESVDVNVFTSFKDLLIYLDDNPIMDLESSLVADNV